jgi:predicted MFS family arabinose efflux permease
VANVYYAHPLLDSIAGSFGISAASMGIVVTVTQVGYAVGLFAVVPLGDIVHRRRLIATQMVLSVGVLVVVATASSRVVLLPAMAVMGLLAVVVQVVVAYAASLAPEHQRGQVVGTVTSGVVVGILLSRTLAGAIAEVGSWRAVYLTSAALTSVLVVVLVRALPRRDHHEVVLPYGRLLRSTVALFVAEPLLRARALLALFTFAAFSVLWSSLVLPLREPPLSLSHGVIGLFGLVGAAGALAAVRAGRLADRGRGQVTTGVALGLLVVSWLPIGFARHSLLSLVVGLLLLDLAVQAVHVTSQSLIYRIDPAARSRLAGAYMIFYSAGSALGSIASTTTYAHAGWTGVCLLGAAISTTGLLFWAVVDLRRGGRDGRG